MDATEHCLAGVARLSNQVNEALTYLPAHDQRTYADAVKALKTRLDDVRAATQPRPKFSFKSRQKNSSAISLTDAAARGDRSGFSSTAGSSEAVSPRGGSDAPGEAQHDAAVADAEEPQYPALHDMREAASIRKPSFSQVTSVTISNHSNLHIILPSAASQATSSGTLSRLRRCVVDMSDPTHHGQPFAGLTLKNIKHSLIICGQVSGPIHITGLERTVVLVSCHQFRMHDSQGCEIYVFCPSRPIIERCEGISFAPLPPYYVGCSMNFGLSVRGSC